MHFLGSIAILPLIKITLRSTATQNLICDWYQYYDPRSNTDSFLQFLMEREGDICVNCSKTSANLVEPCNQICYFDPKINPISIIVLIESKFINEGEMIFNYLLPICVLLAHFMFVFVIALRCVYKKSFEILRILPAPTKNIECKFQTLLKTFSTAGLNVFRSYRYESALYYFSFTESKVIIFSLCSIMIYRINYFFYIISKSVVPWIFSTVSLFISLSHLFTLPYISMLHNIVNIASYFVSGIISLIIGLHACSFIVIPQKIGNFLIVVIVITPIISALITPFFAKKDPLLASTDFDLNKLQKWNKKLDKLLSFRKNKEKALKKRKERNKNDKDDSLSESDYNEVEGIVFEDEPSISICEN